MFNNEEFKNGNGEEKSLSEILDNEEDALKVVNEIMDKLNGKN